MFMRDINNEKVYIFIFLNKIMCRKESDNARMKTTYPDMLNSDWLVSSFITDQRCYKFYLRSYKFFTN